MFSLQRQEMFAAEAPVVVESDDLIIDVTPRYAKTFGYRPEELIGRPIARLMSDIDRWVNGEAVSDHNVVVWYGAHFTHDVNHDGPAQPGHIVGPDLVPVNW